MTASEPSILKIMANVYLHPVLLDQVKWLDLPLIQMPSPDNPEEVVQARISGTTLHQLYSATRRTSIWQAWAHLAGTLPPIPNTVIIRGNVPRGAFGLSTEPIACFRGIRRPRNSEEDGNSVLAYVFNPSHTLAWHSSPVCTAKVVKAPPGTVLVVYVAPVESLQGESGGIFGTITGWEFIPTDPEVPTLPDKFGERYAEELWRR